MATIGVDIRVLQDRRQSGVAVYVRNILANLVRLPGEARFRYFSGGWKPSARPLPSEVLTDRVTVVRPRLPNRALNMSMAFLGRPHLDRLAGPVDRFFLPHVLFAAFSPRCPYVVTVHDLSFLRVPDLFSRWSRLWHAALRVGRLLRGAHRIIALSEHTKRDVCDLFHLPSERVTVIRSGIEPPRPPKASADVFGRLGVRQPYLLVLGTLDPRKNLRATLEAFARVRPRLPEYTQLVFAGGPGWSRVKNFPPSADPALGDRVLLTGEVSNEDRDALLAGAAALLYPSLYEGFGFPVLEAFSAGVPVIASATTAIPEVAGDGAILVDPNNVAEIAAAIERVANDRPLVERLGIAGRRIAAGYRWKAAAEKTLTVLTDA